MGACGGKPTVGVSNTQPRQTAAPEPAAATPSAGTPKTCTMVNALTLGEYFESEVNPFDAKFSHQDETGTGKSIGGLFELDLDEVDETIVKTIMKKGNLYLAQARMRMRDPKGKRETSSISAALGQCGWKKEYRSTLSPQSSIQWGSNDTYDSRKTKDTIYYLDSDSDMLIGYDYKTYFSQSSGEEDESSGELIRTIDIRRYENLSSNTSLATYATSGAMTSSVRSYQAIILVPGQAIPVEFAAVPFGNVGKMRVAFVATKQTCEAKLGVRAAVGRSKREQVMPSQPQTSTDI